jgi:hypothetical protein
VARQFRWQRGVALATAPEKPEIDTVDQAAAGKPRRRLRLHNQEHVARELRKLYAMTLSGELSAIEAARRGRLLKTMAEVLTSSAIERRLKAVEAAVPARRQR